MFQLTGAMLVVVGLALAACAGTHTRQTRPTHVELWLVRVRDGAHGATSASVTTP